MIAFSDIDFSGSILRENYFGIERSLFVAPREGETAVERLGFSADGAPFERQAERSPSNYVA